MCRDVTDLDVASFGPEAIAPDHPDYASARLAHQLAVDQRPLAIAAPRSAEEVREVLAAARAAGVTVAPQAGGHGAGEDQRGSVLLRTDAFDRVEVDREAGTAVVGAGVRAGQLLSALAGTGLVPPVGTSPDVSPVPLMLGGGHAWTSRAVGIAAQSVRRAEIVTGDGEHRWVDDQTDAELMQALRGAGGPLGVVLALEVDLARANALIGGELRLAADAFGAAWRAVRDNPGPEALSSFVSSMRVPDLPMIPEPIRGRSWTAVQSLSLDGDVAALDAVCEAAPSEGTTGPIDVPGITGITNDPRDAAASANRGWLLRELPDEAVDAVQRWRDGDSGAAVLALTARPLGGALDRPGRPTVVDLHGAPWLLGAVAMLPPGADDGARVQAALDELGEVLAPWRGPGGFPTFLGGHERLAAVLDDEALALVQGVRMRTGGEVMRPTRL